MKKYNLLNHLLEYSTLGDNWNGEGAKAPNPQDILSTMRVVNNISEDILPKTMLSSNGTVGLYWDLENIYIDMEVSGNDVSVFLRDRRTQDEKFIESAKIADITPNYIDKLIYMGSKH